MINEQAWYSVFLEKISMFLLLVYPSAFLLVKGGMNGVMVIFLLLAIFSLATNTAARPFRHWRKEWWLYVAAMLGMTMAIFISQLANHDLLARPYDAASRYWLALPIFLFFLYQPPSLFRVLQYAFPIAAILDWTFAVEAANEGRRGISLLGLNQILFGDYLLLLGALSFFSIDWFGRDSMLLRLLKWSGFILGFIAALQSGTRGALLAIPVFFLIYFYFRGVRLTLKVVLLSVVLGAAIVGLTYFSSQTMQQRLHELSSDIAMYDQGNKDTSTGIRWQLNKAAVDIFLSHPIVGVGPEIVGGKPDGFAKEIQKMATDGKLTPEAVKVGLCCQAHNEILAKAADLGLLGVVAILALYFVPFYFFWRATSGEHEQRRAGLLGMIFVSGHFVFGLTVGLLGLTMTAAFYSFTVAVLLAACYNMHHLTDESSNHV